MPTKSANFLIVKSLQAALIGTLFCVSAVHAQDTSRLLYDVSSVRPHNPADARMFWSDQNGKLEAINVNLKNLIADAWGVRPDQVSGEPAWADDESWDVTGKVTDSQENALEKLTRADSKRMDQSLLVERFHAKIHNENRIGRVFDLVPSKNGVKLKASKPEKDDDQADKASMPHGSLSIRAAEGGGFEMVGHGVGIKMLISNIAMNLQQTVIDKTEISTEAVFDFTLKFVPEGGTNTQQNGDAVSLREALEQQLGLHLEATRGPVSTIVVDHVDKPSPN